jgi:Sad1 / UNC-like C-terminal
MNSQYEEPFHFGKFEFNANKTSIETFKFPNRAQVAHKYVKLDFIDNNGDPEQTCVYRIRVHGPESVL